MHSLKTRIRSLVPEPLLSLYHYLIACAGALLYAFPSRRITVVAVTGTKGKTSTTEYLNAICEAAGLQTALINTIRIKVAEESSVNPTGRSMPGRLFLQRFLARAKKAGCTVAILEMTSEGARQHRHRGIDLDALVFLNLAPEHIEAHGSLEAYADAKFELGRSLERSHKRPRIMVWNADDAEGARYGTLSVEKLLPFSLATASPFSASASGGYFTFEGRRMDVHLPGEFSLLNALAAARVAHALGISEGSIHDGLARVERIAGRAEEVRCGQPFTVVVDYAHTPDSLEALYSAYSARKICVVSSTGGGRDRWKRPVMGKVADTHCEHVIVTDEDPYDEDPRRIMDEVAAGMTRKPEIIEDRRAAIARALTLASEGDAVLVSGKGTDTSIHYAAGRSAPWDDAAVVREELARLGYN